MNNLWKPSKTDRKIMSSGDRKVRLGNMRYNLNEGVCPWCGRNILITKDSNKEKTSEDTKKAPDKNFSLEVKEPVAGSPESEIDELFKED